MQIILYIYLHIAEFEMSQIKYTNRIVCTAHEKDNNVMGL